MSKCVGVYRGLAPLSFDEPGSEDHYAEVRGLDDGLIRLSVFQSASSGTGKFVDIDRCGACKLAVKLLLAAIGF